MFNWFKSKVELKKENSIMSSIHNKKGLKLGSEIIVPSDFELLVFHHEKHYTTLSSGKYKMDNKTFLELIETQQKKKSKLKYIKCVCHYVNISQQQLEIRHKKQKFIVDFSITKSINFVNLMLLYAYKVDNDYTIDTLKDIFYELLIYHKGDYKQITNKSLLNYGIEIISFKPINCKTSIFSSINNTTNVESDNINTRLIKHDSPNQINQTITNYQQNHSSEQLLTQQNIDNTKHLKPVEQDDDIIKKEKQSSIKNAQTTFPSCPKCNHMAKFNTTYCLRCGYRLK